MIKFEYRKPRAKNGDLRTWISFYEYAPNEGPEPGESEKKVLYECWAKVDRVWMRDFEQAKSTDTLSDVTITIRDAGATYRPSNKHYLEINAIDYEGMRYNIKDVQPDMQHHDFTTIIAGLRK